MSKLIYHPWYVVRVLSNFEKVSSDCLKEKRFTTFLPLYCTRRRCSDRIPKIEAPLFPGYTLCAFDASQNVPILTTPGVVSILESSSGPIPVSESDVLAVQNMVNSGLPVGLWPFIQQGQAIRIDRGPLRGLEGLILKLKYSYRLVVSVTLLQRSVSAEIDREWVRPPSMRSDSRNGAAARVWRLQSIDPITRRFHCADPIRCADALVQTRKTPKRDSVDMPKRQTRALNIRIWHGANE